MSFFQMMPAMSIVAILSPECQMAREKETILQDDRLAKLLGNQIVRDIQKVEGGYVVLADLCELKVDVTYLPPEPTDLIGRPVRFELVFHEPVYVR